MSKYETIYRSAATALGALTGFIYGNWYPLIGILTGRYCATTQ